MFSHILPVEYKIYVINLLFLFLFVNEIQKLHSIDVVEHNLQETVQLYTNEILKLFDESRARQTYINRVSCLAEQRIQETVQCDINLRDAIAKTMQQLQRLLLDRGRTLYNEIAKVAEERRQAYTKIKGFSESMECVIKQVGIKR